jgi:hypothetical protein
MKNATTQSHRFSTDLNVASERTALTPLIASARQLLTQFLSAVDAPAALDAIAPEVAAQAEPLPTTSGPVAQ